MGRDGGAPEEVSDQVILAYVVAEVVDPWGAVGVGGCEGVKVRESEHVGFADDAGGNGDGGNGGVEFCVGGGEEDFFKESAGGRIRCRDVDDKGELVDKLVFLSLVVE